jgi:hypothetical protein
MRPIHLIAGFAVTGLLGCHQRSAGGGDPGRPRVAADTTVRGIVRVVGSDPFPQVIVRSTDTDQDVGVVGSLQHEIGSLVGVEVSVTGPAIPNRPPRPARAVNVLRYDVLAVDGVPAHAGMLTRRRDAIWLIGARDTVELLGPTPVALAAMLGNEVYVSGRLENGKLHVQAFGAIRRDSLR